jgi:hypothetical protein
MPHQWTIEILDAGNGAVAFRPFVPGAAEGDPLRAESGDTVLWANRTDLTVGLQSTNPAGLALDQTIAAGESSASLFVFPGGRVEYRCTQPEREHVIEVDPGT